MPARASKKPARTGRAGKARSKIADLPDLVPHAIVADKLGITTTILRKWVVDGEFPRPHSTLGQTWLYRVDLIRVYLETGKWPDGATFNRSRPGHD
jgi:hypothetical protein